MPERFHVYGPQEIAEGMRQAAEAERASESLDDGEIGAPLVKPAGLYVVRSLRFDSAEMFDRRKLLVIVQIIGDAEGKPEIRRIVQAIEAPSGDRSEHGAP